MIGLMIRHGHGDTAGREEAWALVRALKWAPLSAVYCSSLGAAVETAEPLARDHCLDIRVNPALTELNGEGEPEMQRRMIDELMTLAKSHPGETIALVTHSEPIRSVLAAFGGDRLGDLSGLDIMPAHVSAVDITPDLRSVLGVNMSAYEVTV